ncbi:hypothetical protein evm_010892 [Chilo suppressalis]|nr:hypothetical protein evm_010892 [Chilo suppressalis]
MAGNSEMVPEFCVLSRHHQPINVPTAGAQAFPMDGIGSLGHDPPRGPSADWWMLTTADAAGTNGLTFLPKHGGIRDSKFLVTHPMTDHCESCLTSTIAAERANHLRHRACPAYAKQGRKHLILVPIAFVNEHIETLHELDIEYCDEIAKEAGIVQIERALAPNDHPTFIGALADIVASHLSNGPTINAQFLTRCPHCVSKRCQSSKEFFRKLCSSTDVHTQTVTTS